MDVLLQRQHAGQQGIRFTQSGCVVLNASQERPVSAAGDLRDSICGSVAQRRADDAVVKWQGFVAGYEIGSVNDAQKLLSGLRVNPEVDADKVAAVLQCSRFPRGFRERRPVQATRLLQCGRLADSGPCGPLPFLRQAKIDHQDQQRLQPSNPLDTFVYLFFSWTRCRAGEIPFRLHLPARFRRTSCHTVSQRPVHKCPRFLPSDLPAIDRPVQFRLRCRTLQRAYARSSRTCRNSM